jgi:hypothetical protein
MRPRCTGCTESQFCSSECECTDKDALLPDLVPDAVRLKESLLIEEVDFDSFSCALHEGCVSGTGRRRLLRLDTTTVNQGNADLVLKDPTMNPHEFTFGRCHNHYHFQGYSQFQLLTLEGEVVASGHKQGYCMQDSTRQSNLPGPRVRCRAEYFCENPGISMGWSDVYGNDIDCQWVDITDIAAGEYLLRMELNVERRFLESTTENNVAAVKVTVPPMGGTEPETP